MGTKKRNRRHFFNKGNQQRKRRRRNPKFWIEDFPDLIGDGKADISVWITRSLLSDDHQNGVTTEPSKDKTVAKEDDSSNNQQDSAPKLEEDVKKTNDEPTSTLENNSTKDDVPSLPGMPSSKVLGDPVDQEEEKTTLQPDADDGDGGGGGDDDDDDKGKSHEPVIFVKRIFDNTPIRFPKNSPSFRQLPNGDCGDGIVNPHPKDQVPDKYWAQRKRYFSRFEDGIRLDKEGWFSVTPEKIAQHIAQRMVSFHRERSVEKDGMVVLDAFCGVGGNSIAFAAHPEVALVICVDTQESRLELTANNCRVYNIPNNKVLLIKGDACRVLESYQNGIRVPCANVSTDQTSDLHGYTCGGLELLPERLDSIFLSPPWGGTQYVDIGPRQYNLSHIRVGQDVDGKELLRKCKQALASDRPSNIVYYLPRNLNGLSFARSALACGFSGHIDLEMNLLNYKFKTISAYVDVPAPSHIAATI